MKNLLISLCLIPSLSFAAAATSANSIVEIAERCSVEDPTLPYLQESDFSWNMTLEQVLNSFKSVYTGPKRLSKRAYFDKQTKSIRLPYTKENGGDVEVPLNFVNAIQGHIEFALKHRYADAVIFPDLGHSHYLIPLDIYEKKYNVYPVSQMSQMYTELFKDPSMKIVYHTAEQLTTTKPDKSLMDDPYLQWRHFTRNVVGDNTRPYNVNVLYAKDQSPANTLNDYAGYYWWGGGFNVSANKDGCFRYFHQGKTFFFDLSLFDLPASANE